MNAYKSKIFKQTDSSYQEKTEDSLYNPGALPLVIKVYSKRKDVLNPVSLLNSSHTPLSWNMKNSDLDTEWIIDGKFLG